MEIKQDIKITKLPHHESKGPCITRPPYRQGKKLTAVKVYTVNNESQHLIIRGVPALNLYTELKRLCLRYGGIKKYNVVNNYSEDEEPFTEVYRVQYDRMQAARFAKHMLDNKSYFGGILKVYYAPELETLSETRNKLQNRRREIAIRLNKISNNTVTNSKHKNETSITGSLQTGPIEPSSSLLQENADVHNRIKSYGWIEGGLRSVNLIPHAMVSDKSGSNSGTVMNTEKTNLNVSDGRMTMNDNFKTLVPRPVSFPVKRSKYRNKNRKK